MPTKPRLTPALALSLLRAAGWHAEETYSRAFERRAVKVTRLDDLVSRRLDVQAIQSALRAGAVVPKGTKVVGFIWDVQICLPEEKEETRQ